MCLIIEIKPNTALAKYPDPGIMLGDDMAYGEMTINGDHTIQLDVLAQHSDVTIDDHFTIEQPIDLTEEVCQQLGCKSLTLQPGVYQVDYAACRLGTIMIDMMMK